MLMADWDRCDANQGWQLGRAASVVTLAMPNKLNVSLVDAAVSEVDHMRVAVGPVGLRIARASSTLIMCDNSNSS